MGFDGFTISAPPFEDGEVVIGTLTALRDSDDIAAEMAEQKGEPFEFEFAFIEWVWTTQAPEGFNGGNEDGTVNVSGRTSKSSGPRSKAFKWIAALVGPANVTPGANFSPDTLIGQEAQLTLSVNDRGYNQVEEVTALPRR